MAPAAIGLAALACAGFAIRGEAQDTLSEPSDTVETAQADPRTARALELNDRGVALVGQGKPAEAEPLLAEALQIYRERSGESHPDAIVALLNLARVVGMQGRAADAEALHRRAHALGVQVLGEAHPYTLTAMTSLAEDLRSQGRAAEAEPLDRRAYALSRESLGESHPDTIVALANLAADLRAQGLPAEAEPLDRRAFALSTQALGESHPVTLIYLNNLGEDLRAQGQAAQAEQIHHQVVDLAERHLGDGHFVTLAALNNLARDLGVLGRYSEVEALDRRVLDYNIRIHGERSLATLTSVNNLAEDLRALGRPAEAERLDRRALALNRQLLGDAHPNTITSLTNLGEDLRALGRADEAEPLFREALELASGNLGPSHPLALSSLDNLARNLRTQGRLGEAETAYRQSLAAREKGLGEDHPDTLITLSSLAETLQSRGRPAEAEPLHRRAASLAERVLGETHPTTLISLNNLAETLRSLDRPGEAETIHRRMLALSASALGESHPISLLARNNLAGDLRELGRLEDAEALHRRTLELTIERFGEQHPSTLLSLNNLGGTLRDRGEAAEAERLYTRALAAGGAMMGATHPDVLAVAANLARAQLEQPDKAALALPSARLALVGRTQRFGDLLPDAERARSQQQGERMNLQATQRLFADAAWSAGHDVGLRAEAFAALQGASAGAAARAIAEVAARRYAVSAGAGELVAQRKALGERWAASEQRLTEALAGGDQQSARREALREELAAIEARIEGLDAEIARKAPQYVDIVNQPALSLAEAQGLLREDEAVLMVVPSLFGTHVMALTREGLQWHRADMNAKAVGELVGTLRAQLDPSGQARATTLGSSRAPKGNGFDRKAAWQLHEALVAPVAASLAGKAHVFVAADGALASLPFGVLVTQPPEPGSDDTDPAVLRATPWLADVHALVQIPSLQSLAWLRTYNAKAKKKATVSFAGFGDPLLGGQAMTRGSRNASLPVTDASGFAGAGASEAGAPLMDPAALRRLARLPGTRAELEAMRATLGAPVSSLKMEAAMTEGAIRSADLSRTRILHLATHGLTASESGARAEPGLVFTPPQQASNEDDGYLAASEVLAMDLASTEWVILSACNTAAPSGNPGDAGLSGLARAFFYAGAPSLLASHWPVDDAVAARLTVDTLRRAQDTGISRAQALQAAMRAIRNDAVHPAWAHPAAWAPFTLVGEGR